jgi:iron complex outermembrane receptor protein
MTIRPEASPWLRLIGGFIVAASLAFSPQVLAQDTEDEEDDAEEAREEIIVTGSRLKRDTYTSIAPLQVITGQVSREVGLIDAGDILQESSASSGQQIDLTFQGFVLDNGPGATTVDLRGLGAARTLVMLNGRRMAPAGVEGAPYSPDLSLVPASLVQQYDLLLDGASSVYGSDAVAGVVNIIMRKDFDGFEFETYSRVPDHSNGIEHTLSAVWGRNFDRGFVGVGAEWVDSERVSLDDRPWTAGCDRHQEIDEYGQIRTRDEFYSNVYGMEWDDCSRFAHCF